MGRGDRGGRGPINGIKAGELRGQKSMEKGRAGMYQITVYCMAVY
jgi:hypothetical protein